MAVDFVLTDDEIINNVLNDVKNLLYFFKTRNRLEAYLDLLTELERTLQLEFTVNQQQ